VGDAGDSVPLAERRENAVDDREGRRQLLRSLGIGERLGRREKITIGPFRRPVLASHALLPGGRSPPEA